MTSEPDAEDVPMDAVPEGDEEANLSDGEPKKERMQKEREPMERAPETAEMKSAAVSRLGLRGGGFDRTKICPFLLRVFVREEVHHNIDDFTASKVPSADEVTLYTWTNATLRELSYMIARKFPKAGDRYIRLSFRHIFQDIMQGGKYTMKEVGSFTNYRKIHDEDKSLKDIDFTIGDYIDIAIMDEVPKPRSSSNDYVNSNTVRRRENTFQRRQAFGSDIQRSEISSYSNGRARTINKSDRWERSSRTERRDDYRKRYDDDYRSDKSRHSSRRDSNRS